MGLMTHECTWYVLLLQVGIPNVYILFYLKTQRLLTVSLKKKSSQEICCFNLFSPLSTKKVLIWIPSNSLGKGVGVRCWKFDLFIVLLPDKKNHSWSLTDKYLFNSPDSSGRTIPQFPSEITLPVNQFLINIGYILPATVQGCFPCAGLTGDVDQLVSGTRT